MTKDATGAGFASELLGGVPEAFVQTALLAGGVGLWEWPVGTDNLALSPYLETLLGYPSGGFDGTKATFLARLKLLDRQRFEFALAEAIDRGAELDLEFRVSDINGDLRYFVAKGRVMRDSSGIAVRLVGTMQEIPASVVTERRMRRQQSALLALVSSERDADLSLDDTLAQITALAGATLDVERTSVWLFTADRLKLECRSLFRRSLGRQMAGAVLDVSAYPAYIRALEQNRALDASDAQNDPRTRELTAGYLVPLGITSMLEATVRMDTGALAGVVCHEHVGPIRQWMLDEKTFAASIADMVTRALTADRRRQLTAALAQSEDGIAPMSPSPPRPSSERNSCRRSGPICRWSSRRTSWRRARSSSNAIRRSRACWAWYRRSGCTGARSRRCCPRASRGGSPAIGCAGLSP